MFPFGRRKQKQDTELYDILGVSKTASDSEIKKAFNKASLKGEYRHPDKGGDNEKFSKLSFAKEVLLSPEKRQVYDEAGMEGLKGMDNGTGGGFPDDLLSQFFPGINVHSTRHRPAPRKSKSFVIEHAVRLEDLYNGKKLHIDFKRLLKCQKCHAKGALNEKDIEQCSMCHGTGTFVQTMQMGPIIQQHHTTCHQCRGKKEQIKEGHECPECQGNKLVEKDTKLEVDIGRGCQHGEQILLRGQSHEDPDCSETGDLIIVIKQKNHDGGFQRKGADLFLEKEIDLVEALTGTSFWIKHLDGQYKNLTYDGVINPKTILKVEEEGMPYQDNISQFGDLYVSFLINFPTKLDTKRTSLLRKILPKPNKLFDVKPPQDCPPEKMDKVKMVEMELPDLTGSTEDTFESDTTDGGVEGESGPECTTQ